MKLRPVDHRWLLNSYPDLLHDAQTNILVGDVGLCASYNESSRQLRLGDDADRGHPSFLCDAFSIRIELDSIGKEGWPKVFEAGGRNLEIAEREGIDLIDLHFYDDASCCLGQRAAPERLLGIDRFMKDLVIPFLYRLAYVDEHGLEAARRDLWGEYSHGYLGRYEYGDELYKIGLQSPGRNELCPCGSGKKYKRCHLDEVKAFVRNQTWVRRP